MNQAIALINHPLAANREEAGAAGAPHPVMERHWRLSWRWVHKWGGIISALWLCVLGVTGFFLDHRDWRFIWQTGVPEAFFPGKFLEDHRRADLTVYQVDPSDPARKVAGGRRGLWVSSGEGGWKPAVFQDASSPQVLALLADPAFGWNRLYAATDDGVWISPDGGVTYSRFGLEGRYVNAISPSYKDTELLCAVDRSHVYVLNTQMLTADEMHMQAPGKGVAPPSIGFSRFIHDLHFGRGIFSGITSLLINDFGGIGLLFLPVSGLVFWLLPLRWRGKEGKATHGQRMRHRFTMKVLHRSHGIYIGLLAIIPVVYLALTGIILDHRDTLNDLMKKIKIGQAFLPPVYDLGSWDDEISSVMGYENDPGKISLGARSGLYTSTDKGVTWKREELPGPPACYVWSMSRVAGGIFIGGMGCPNYISNGAGWSKVEGKFHMPVGAAMGPGGMVTMLSHGALWSGTFEKGFEKRQEEFPAPAGAPLFTLLDGLHSGLIIHKQWIWVNDLVSVLAVVLCVSGIIRVWRSRRVIARDFQSGAKAVAGGAVEKE